MPTQIIGGHYTGLLDGSFSLLNRNDPTGAGTIGHGAQADINVSNGNLVYQERDAYLQSLGIDFDLVRTYNSRGHFGDLANGWSLSTQVILEQHTDQLANGGGTIKNFSVTYGDGSYFHLDYDAKNSRWVSTDAPGAFEVLTDLGNNQPDGAQYLLVRSDQSRYRFDKLYHLLSITDPNGVTTKLSYTNNRVTQAIDGSGDTINFNYDSTGHLANITRKSAADNRVTTLVQYAYSGNLLAQATDRMGHVTKYAYDPGGLLIGVSLPSDAQTPARSVSFTYTKLDWGDTPHTNTPFDQANDFVLTQMTDAMGGTTSFDYTFQWGTTFAPGDRDQVYKPTGARDFQGGTTRVVDALGNARAYSNDAEYVAWRQARGSYATYQAGVSPQAQIDAIRTPQSAVYTYDANGQITQVVDQQGFKSTYKYDLNNGNLLSTVDRDGYAAIAKDDQTPGDGYYRKLRVDLGFADQPISWFTAQTNWSTVQAQILARFTTTFTYDANGNQISSTDGSGNQTTFTYTAFNKVATITSALGNALATSDAPAVQAKRVELGYAATVGGLGTQQKTALQRLYTTTFTYDANQNLTQRIDAVGRANGGDVTTYEYDTKGNLTKRTAVVLAAGTNAAMTEVTAYGYDAYGNNTTITDAEGATTTRVFDTFGNLVASTDPRGGVTTYTYDADNRLLATQTPDGRVTTNAYDAVGNRIAITDFAGHTVTQVFDKNNLLITTIDPALSGAGQTRTTGSKYDILGNRTQLTDAEGRVFTYAYDSRRLMVTATTPQVLKADGTQAAYTSSYAYDGEGNAITLVDNNGNTTQTLYNNLGLARRITDATGQVTEYLYDANLQQIQITLGAQLPAGQRRVLQYSFDEENQLVTETDALNGKRTSTYDAVGNVVAIKDENGNMTNFRFDRDNRLVLETKPGALDPVTNASTVYTVQHQYDANGNEVRTTDENGHVTQYFFDRDDRGVMVVDANGIKTVYEYDSRNNTTKVAIGVAATYNAATGHVTIDSATNGQVETYAYDEFNQLVSHTDANGNVLAANDPQRAQFTETYTYDHVGNRRTQTDHLGRVTQFTYDTLDRLQSRTDAAETTQARTTSYRYDGNDNRVRTTDALGRSATYAFDAADRITDATDALGTVTHFEYDSFGNKTSETRAYGSGDARTTNYLYDLNDRLIQETSPEGRATVYTYDAVGNRLTATTGVGVSTETTRFVYDALNRNIQVTDALGLVTKLQYDGKGNQIAIVDPKGGVKSIAYDPGDRAVQITDAAGRVTRYAYDQLGNVVSTTTAATASAQEQEVTTFAYDAEGNLLQVTDPLGNVSTSAYDAAYNVIRVVDGNGHATTTAYDALNRQITVTDAANGTTSYTYDAVDNRLSETDALGRTRRFAYDADDRIITQTDALGTQTVYAYDRADNRVSITEAANVAGQARTTQFFYDRDDLLLRQVDALNGATVYTYDANRNVTSVTDAKNHTTTYAYDLDNRVTSITDPLGAVTSYAYDGNGNRVRVTDARGAATTFYYNGDNELVRTIDALGYVTTKTYDGNGNVVAQTQFANAVAVPSDPSLAPPAVTPNSAADRTTRFAYDKLNRLVQQTSGEGNVTRYAFDAVGNKISETDPNGNVTTFAYDVLDRQTSSTDARGNTRRSAYDAVGNRVSDTDALGRITSYTYDAENRVTSTKDALDGITTFAYDKVGNRTSSTDEKGRTTTFAYDANNRQIQQTDALGGIRTMAYDAVGNKTSDRDANGHTTTFAYDAGDRLVAQTDALGKTRTFAYDATGNQIGETDENGHTTTSAYDLDGRLVRQTVDPTGLNLVRRFAYDAVGNKTGETDPSGHTTLFAYDRDNRLIAQTDPLGHTRTFAYDAAGNQTGLTDENGHATTFAYDALNRQVSTTKPLGGTTLATYDAVGNQTSRTDENGNTRTYVYDALDRLTSATDPLGGVRRYTYDAVGNRLTDTDERGKTSTFTYDALDRQVTATNALGGVTTTTYDAVGNKLSEQDPSGRTASWQYDADDRLTAQTDSLGHTRSQTYDDAGNLKTQTDENGHVVTFVYDAANRVTQQQNPIGTLQYGYDAAGNRTSLTDENNQTTTYAYDANDRLVTETDPLGGTKTTGYDAVGNKTSETDENNHTATYTYDANDRMTQAVDGEGYATTLLYDAAGNAVQRTQQLDLLDPSKTAVTTEAYDALNRVTATLTADGRLITYEYDASGNVTVKTEYDGKYAIPSAAAAAAPLGFAAAAAASSLPAPPAPASGDNGRRTRRTYDDDGRLVSETTPDDVQTTYSYDAAGNRTGDIVAYGGGAAASTAYTYDSAGRVTDSRDAMGIVTHYVLDARGNVTDRYDAYGTAAQRHTQYVYDSQNRVTSETDALGIVTTYTYDARGDMLTRVRAGRTESFEYDAKRRLVAEVNGNGDRTEYSYDRAGNRTEIRSGVVGNTALRTVSYQYDASDHVVAQVDGNGVRTAYRYDGAGNRIETIQNADAPAAQQRHTTYEYDRDNRLTKVTNAEGGVTTYGYDALGNQTRIVDPNGNVTQSTYDRNGRVLTNIVGTNGAHGGIKTENTYDARGNTLSTTVSYADGTDTRTTRYTYDALDRQTLVTDAEGFSVRFEYDAFGNQTKITTGLYLLTSTEAGYDAAKAAHAHASEIDFGYDALDRLTDTTQITDNAAHTGDTLHATYDAFGNRLSQTTGYGTSDARTVSFSYDGANRLVRRQTGAGGIVTLGYDHAGNQTAKHTLQSGVEGTSSAIWLDQTFEYDGNGLVTAENDRLDATTTVRTEHRFDAFGNETDTILAQGSADQRTTHFVYNRNNDMVSRTEAYGTTEARTTQYTVDLAGRTLKETDALGRVTRFYYDAADRQSGTLDPEGYYTAFVRDSQGNVTQSTVYMHRYADATPGQYDTTAPTVDASEDPLVTTNTYDRVNNLVRQVLADGTRTDYAYDANRKLTLQTNYGSSDAARLSRTANTAPQVLTFTYDDANRLTGFVNVDGSVESYGYDSANNQISEQVSNSQRLPGDRAQPVRLTTFQYDADNRLTRQTFDPSGLNLVEQLAYDKAGNVVSKTDANGRVTTTTLDAFGRVSTVTDATGAVTGYGYDLVGNQTSVTDALGRTTNFSYDHLNQLVRTQQPAVTVYTIDGGQLDNQRPTTTIQYDAVGNVVQETDANGHRKTTWYDGNDNVIAELDGDNVLRTATFDATGAALTTTLYMTRLGDSAHAPSGPPPSAPAGASRTNSFEYDKGRRVTRTIFPPIDVTTVSDTSTGDNPSATTATVTTDSRNYYDAFGNLVESVDPRGNHSYGYYDARGRQVATVDSAGYLIETTYDNQSNAVQQKKYVTPLTLSGVSAGTRPTAPTGDVAVVDRIYDAANRLVEEIAPAVQLTSGLERIHTLNTYDAVGNLVSRTLASGTSDAQTEYYWYDADNRQVAVVNAGRTLHTFTYDLNGNKTQQKRYYNPVSSSVNLATATLSQVVTTASADNDEQTDLTYDALNRLSSQSSSVQTASGSTSVTQSSLYDAAGNVTRRTDGDGYVTKIGYDANGHATRTVTPDGTTSFIEYDAAGLKVRAWTGVLDASGAQAASNVAARVGAALQFSWHQDGSNVQSYVVYDTATHGDGSFASTVPSAVYAHASASAGSGDVAVNVNLAQFTAGQTVYFRVVTVDAAGNQAWTAERSAVVPARVTSISTRPNGSNVTVTVSFNGSVASPTLLYGTASTVASSVSPSGSSGNTYTFSVPSGQATYFAVRWTFTGTTYTTDAAKFDPTGPHQYDSATGELHWTLPTALASQQTSPGQVIVIDGVRLDGGYTFNGTIHLQPTLTTGSHGIDVFYGNTVATSHTATVQNVDSQTYSQTSTGGTATAPTRTFTASHNYHTDFNVTLNAAEAGAVSGTVHVAYRTAGTGAAFTGDLSLTRSTNVFTGSVSLAPGNYDLKIYYTDTSGREVIVEWRRVTVASTTLAASVTQTDSTDPYNFVGISPPSNPAPATTATNNYSGNSVTVLATETGGTLTKSGSNVAAVAGTYVGPLDTTGSPFSLTLGSTSGTTSGTRASNGLLAQTYFTEIEYNALGMKVASNEDDGLWRRFGVDASGNKVQTKLYGTKAAETANQTPIVTFSAFDARNLEIASFGAAVLTDGSGSTLHRAVTRTTYNYAGQVASVLDPTPGATARSFTYDFAGNRVRETDALGNATTYAYDRFGHVVSVTDARGNTRRRTYDSAGRMTRETDALNHATTYTYDGFDRITQRTDADGYTTQYAYDRRDRLITETDALGHAATYRYDNRDNRTVTIDVNGDTLTQVYDGLGRVTQTSSSSALVPDGAAVTQAVRYGYDAYNNRISETDEAGNTRYMSYGAFGRLLRITDEGGRVTEFGYDRFGRATSETSADTGKSIARGYNDAGWLTGVVDSGTDTGTRSTTYTYDIAGHRKSEILVFGSNTAARNQTYSYDGIGRMTRWSDTVSGLALNYAWDAVGNQARVYSDGATPSTNHIYAYDANNRVTSVSNASGAIAAYTYDSAGNRITYTAGSSTAHYTYDGLGRVTSSDDGAGHTIATWSYDNLGNVLVYTDYKSDGTTVLHQTTNTYYANGLTKTSHNVTTEKVSDDDDKKDQTTTSEYDVAKNLVKQTLVDATKSDDVKTYTYTFTYSGDGRVLSVSASGPKDASGNSTSTYDADDHLIRLDKGKGDGADSAEILTFTYDNDGHIVTRNHDDGKDDNTNPSTRFVYANGNPVGETGTDKDNHTVTLLDVNGKSGDGEDMQYNPLVNIGKDYPSSLASTYTVRLGDTLQSVAGAVYGNPSLWFLIADANGLAGSESLKAGQVLNVPTTVQTGRLDSDTHVLYKESDIIGSKLPNLKTPEPSKCALIAAIILIVIVAIVAIVATVLTAGALAPVAAAALGFTAGSVGAIVTTVAVGAVVGAVIGFAASVVTQGILVGFKLQQEFDWKQVAADTVVGFISGGVSGLGEAVQLASIASKIGKVAFVAGQAALEAAGEVARQAIANDGRIDNPWTILVAGAGGAFGAIASRAVRSESQLSRGVGGVLERRIVEVAPTTGKAGRLLGKTKVVANGINLEQLAKFEEGATIFKNTTTKLVKSVDETGAPILRQVERTAFDSKTPKTILKLKDTKLVKIGDEIREVPRISSQFTLAQRVGNKITAAGESAVDVIKSVPGKISNAASAAAGAVADAGRAAASALRSVPGKVADAAAAAAGKVKEVASAAASALRALPAKAAEAFNDAKDAARLVARTIRNGVSNFIDSATTAVRQVGRAASDLAGRVAQGASEAWNASKAALGTVKRQLFDFASNAADAVKSLPGKAKQSASELAQSFKEFREAGTVSKSATTKIVRSFEDGPNGRVAKLTEVLRESFQKKGFKTIAKADSAPGLADGAKLVRVGDEIQTWRRVSSQYTTAQRINRFLARTAVLNKVAGSEFKVNKTITKFADTKIVRTGFTRKFNEATQLFEEVPVFQVQRRLSADGLDKTTRLVQGISDVRDAVSSGLSRAATATTEGLRTAKQAVVTGVSDAATAALDGLRSAKQALGNAVVATRAGLRSARAAASQALSNAATAALNGIRTAGKAIASLPGKAYQLAADGVLAARRFAATDLKLYAKLYSLKALDAIGGKLTKANLVNYAGFIGFTAAKAGLRDYDDDRAGGNVSTLIFVGRNLAFAALKRPREGLNSWLLHQETGGIGKGNGTVALGLQQVRHGLEGMENKHGWFPLEWVATGTNALSRVQSPIDLDYNARYDQQLSANQLKAGQTASFEPMSVFDFENDLDGRVVNQKIPLLMMSNLPPSPAAGLA